MAKEKGRRGGVIAYGIGLKTRGPKIGLVERLERRSRDLKAVEIGKRDFQSSDKSILVATMLLNFKFHELD